MRCTWWLPSTHELPKERLDSPNTRPTSNHFFMSLMVSLANSLLWGYQFNELTPLKNGQQLLVWTRPGLGSSSGDKSSSWGSRWPLSKWPRSVVMFDDRLPVMNGGTFPVIIFQWLHVFEYKQISKSVESLRPSCQTIVDYSALFIVYEINGGSTKPRIVYDDSSRSIPTHFLTGMNWSNTDAQSNTSQIMIFDQPPSDVNNRGEKSRAPVD